MKPFLIAIVGAVAGSYFGWALWTHFQIANRAGSDPIAGTPAGADTFVPVAMPLAAHTTTGPERLTEFGPSTLLPPAAPSVTLY